MGRVLSVLCVLALVCCPAWAQVSETFDTDDGTTLGPNHGWTEFKGITADDTTWEIVGGKATCKLNAACYAYCDESPATANQYVSASVAFPPSGLMALLVRCEGKSRYEIRAVRTVTVQRVSIYEFNAIGSFSLLGTQDTPLAESVELGCYAIGGQIIAMVDGVDVLTCNDPTPRTGVGVGFLSAGLRGGSVDWFEASDVE